VRTALILGAGVSGTSAAKLLGSRGVAVRFFDDRRSVVERLVSGGEHADGAPWSDRLLDDIDFMVVSPGWAPGTKPVVAARERGLAIVSEIELAIPDLDCPVVAITGTNGKTTVTELIASMGEAGGMTVVAAGNIGRPLSDVVGEDADAIALEMSSFQLYWTESLAPTVAVVLNVAADHLDWHCGLEAYREAKAKIFALQDGSDVVVFDVDDDGAASLVMDAASRRVPISGRHLPADGYGVDQNALVLPSGMIPLEDLEVSDPAFLADLVAAAVTAHEIGVPHDAIALAASGFVPSAHRRTLVGEWEGVRWLDDSKATNPHAALASINAYESVVLIAGGRNKGLDIRPLADARSVRFLIAIGEAGDDLILASGERPARKAASMEEAVALAESVAVAGDVVLLAPGCASFDMYTSYGERGDVFASTVREMKGEA